MSASLALSHVTFGYDGRRVIDDVSVVVRPGEVLAIVGPNSAGKTTLLRLMTRVVMPQQGVVTLDGQDVTRLARVALARAVAVVPQDLALTFPFTALDFVLTGRYPHRPGEFFERVDDVAVARTALAAVAGDHLADRLVSELSGGERQLVLVARALAQRPRVLLMDEPNAHLDLRHQRDLARLIHRLHAEGTTIVLVSHDLNLAAQLADRLLLLAAGRVAALGTPADVLVPETLEAVYGCPVVVDEQETGRPRVSVRWLDDTPVRGGAAR
ncbi:MAG: ABC transporter ATP-binding protein [Candidatus Rokubacteria bacterium]|nr:ABC transporter ATP-binding protein [Candidatus Rokubacteria bacterium]